MRAVRILGIDPGTLVVGYACLEIEERASGSGPRRPGVRPLALRAANVARRGGGAGRARLVEAGALRLPRNRSIGDRLAALSRALDGWIETFEPGEIALEEAFCGKSVQSALRIGEARGVVLAVAHRAGFAVHQYPPARIKRSVAGHGAASKESVARMIAQELGIERVEGPADAGDAVAVALCRVEERRTAHAFERVRETH